LTQIIFVNYLQSITIKFVKQDIRNSKLFITTADILLHQNRH